LAKPSVDGLAKDLEGQIEVLRLSIMDDVGRQLAARYGVQGVPTFILLNGEGEVILKQAGQPDRASILAAVADVAGQ
jgi:cytochrome c-type biogenesis protein